MKNLWENLYISLNLLVVYLEKYWELIHLTSQELKHTKQICLDCLENLGMKIVNEQISKFESIEEM